MEACRAAQTQYQCCIPHCAVALSAGTQLCSCRRCDVIVLAMLPLCLDIQILAIVPQ